MSASPMTQVGVGETRVAWVPDTSQERTQRLRPRPEVPPPLGP